METLTKHPISNNEKHIYTVRNVHQKNTFKKKQKKKRAPVSLCEWEGRMREGRKEEEELRRMKVFLQ